MLSKRVAVFVCTGGYTERKSKGSDAIPNVVAPNLKREKVRNERSCSVSNDRLRKSSSNRNGK
jgi:hypothetical protein